MSHYLVTGAAGFIGSNVCQELLRLSHTVVGVDDLNPSYDVRLKQWRLQRLEELRNFQFHPLDICDRSELSKLLDSSPGFDGLLNLAARAGVRQSVRDPSAYYATNVGGTLNLLELCSEFGIQKFVLASTSSLYGETDEIPFHEGQPTDSPLSPYAASKKAAETLAYTYHYLKGIDVTVFRYFTVYGPAGRPDMSPFRFVQWIREGIPVRVFGDGKQERDFTYVDDIARGTVLGLKPVGYEIINLGSHAPVALLDFIRMIEELVGKKALLDYLPKLKVDVSATCADVTKAERLLGWVPQTSLNSGLESLVRWYRENRSWAKDVKTRLC